MYEIPVGIPSSLEPRPKPLTTVPETGIGQGISGEEGPTIRGRSGLMSVLVAIQFKNKVKEKDRTLNLFGIINQLD